MRIPTGSSISRPQTRSGAWSWRHPRGWRAVGLSKEMLKAGTKATVMGYQNKVEKNELRAERITIADKTIELR